MATNRFPTDTGLLDRLAMLLSAVCVVHCFATAAVLALFSTAGGLLGDPIIHEIGLALALALGVVALGRGLWRHGRLLPAAIGAAGLALMGWALAIPHGGGEVAGTVAGVALLAFAHWLNRRAGAR